MFYIVIDPNAVNQRNLLFDDIKEAKASLKESDGRMKTFRTKEEALTFMDNLMNQELTFSLANLTLDESNHEPTSNSSEEQFPSAKPGLLNQLRRQIEAGNYEEVEKTIWSNPRCLVTVCDSATYLMAGPKYNASHIAARANKPEILGLILDTISNISFLTKLYPDQSQDIVQDRINHLLDSYLNTPDPRQGNTPLHFACKKGFYKVAKVLLTFEGCDLKIKDTSGLTAEESICTQAEEPSELTKQKFKDLFRVQPHSPLHRDQLKKRLLLTKRLSPSKSGDS